MESFQPHILRPAPNLEVQFDPVTHTYWVNGLVWPGVSNVLADARLNVDYGAVNPEALARAGERGSGVHAATHFLQLRGSETWADASVWGTAVELLADPSHEGFLVSWTKAMRSMNWRPIELECIVVSPLFHYCGTFDGWGIGSPVPHQDIPLLIDTKTRKTRRADGFQLAGYLSAFLEYVAAAAPDSLPHAKATKRATLELRADGKQGRVVLHEDPNDLTVFRSAALVMQARANTNPSAYI